jgi:retron-type reverse transcriptase
VKPLRRLFFRITSFANLLAAARRAQRGKRYRPDVLAFHANLEAELLLLQQQLRSFSYQPGPYRRFTIRDPKPRLISAAPYRDRVVHHALCAVIVPPIERGFHPGSFANRRGFGSHRALRQFIAAAARHRWVFSADIRLYFPSLDLTLLRAQLRERISCPSTIWLLDQILANGACIGPALDAFPGDSLLTPLERARGLPIGNLTSQFLANFHLNQLDHTLSALPGISAYLRYVDDFALFADSPEPLWQARCLVEAELAALRLRLHPIKSQIRRCGDGASFVGFFCDAWPGAGAQSQPAQRSPPTALASCGVSGWPAARRHRQGQLAELECPPGPRPHLAPAPPLVSQSALRRRLAGLNADR